MPEQALSKEAARAEYVLLLEKMVPSKKQREIMLAAFLDGYTNGERIERNRWESKPK